MAGAGYKLFNTGDVLTAAQVNTYLQEQAVMRFANATARTTALSGVLAEGMMSYLDDTNSVEVYNGSAWVSVGSTGDITGVTAGTGISGGGSSGDVTITNSMATAIDAKGDLIVGTGADTFSRLAVGGTNGHVLTVDSGEATGMKWAAAGGSGGLTLIQETVASANSSITFGSISGSYKQLMLIWSGVYFSNAGEAFGLRLNNDSGSNYAFLMNRIFGTTAQTTRSNTGTDLGDAGNGTGLFGYDVTTSNDVSKAANGYLLIDNYASTTRWKTWTGQWTQHDGPANNYGCYGTGVYKSLSAITSLDIVRITGSNTLSNQTNTSIRLYGVS